MVPNGTGLKSACSTHGKANPLTPGCGEGKYQYNIYYRVPGKENEQLVLKRSELPTSFWRWIFKGNSGGVVAGCLSIFHIFLNWLLAEGDILGVNIINLVFPTGLRSICWLLVVSICGNLLSIKTTQEGLPWWSNVEDSGLPIHGVQLWTLLRELDAPRSNEDERFHGPQLRQVQQK